MDIYAANRNAPMPAVVGTLLDNVTPAVSDNGKTGDPLVARAAGEPEAGARSGDSDNNRLRARKSAPGAEYTAQEQAQLQDLRARDREVRAHEMAHLAAAGSHARGGPSFTYESGPDGRRYAVAGEVSIDTAEIAGDPAATLDKAQQVRRAALAPADPSPQDRQVAAQAAAMAAQASAELAQQRSDPADETAGHRTAHNIDQAYAVPTPTDSPLIELLA